MKKLFIALLFIILLTFRSDESSYKEPLNEVDPFDQESSPEPSDESPQAEEDSAQESDRGGLGPKQMTIRHIQGNENNVPFLTNYTTLQIILASDYVPGRVMPMCDLRGHRFDNTTYAFNAGIGGRYIPNDRRKGGICQMMGFNAYYDYKQATLGYFQQASAGIEVLGRRWDFRANAYVPFGKIRHQKTCIYDQYSGGFFAINRKVEQVSYSFNGEIGVLAVDIDDTWLLYMAGGPYYISGRRCENKTPGGEFRIRPQYKDYFYFEASVRYDSLFKLIYQFEFSFNIPLYQIAGQNRKPCGLTDRQIYQSVNRFEILPLSRLNCWSRNW